VRIGANVHASICEVAHAGVERCSVGITINQSRTINAGRVTVEVLGDPIEHNLDELELGAGVAAALAAAIAAGIKGISQAVSPATLVYREKARRAVERGAAWALERYAGGGTPGSGSTLFNDSEELAAGVAVRAASDGYEITVPSDRLGADLPGSAPGSVIGRLVAAVQALRDPFSVSTVRSAIEASWSKLFRRA
jgi:hypothetical protein